MQTTQMLPQINYIICKNKYEQYRMYYTAWGCQETSTKTLLCVHGLGRNGRDWDLIGNHFARNGYFVIAPDIVGHGNSDYLKNSDGYEVNACVMDLVLLIKTLKLTNINWLGTSMGGILGISVAASTDKLIQKMILNDIGAETEYSGLIEILNFYAGTPVEFDSYTLIKDYVINASREFGNIPDKIWDTFVANCVQKNMNGKYMLKRDINIGRSVEVTTGNANLDLWEYWKQITIPTLVIRGQHSDILSMNTVKKMQEINPKAQHVEIANAGHAPFLYSDGHFTILDKFLNE